MVRNAACWLVLGLSLGSAAPIAAQDSKHDLDTDPPKLLDVSGAFNSNDRALEALLSPAGLLGARVRAAGSYEDWRAQQPVSRLRPPGEQAGSLRPHFPPGRLWRGGNAPVNLATAYEAQFPHISYQTEGSVTASGGRLLAGFNDSYGFATPDEGGAGWAYSVDGGATWVDGRGLPRFGRNVLYLGDPVVTHDDAANFYYSTLVLDYGSSYQNRSPVSGLAAGRGRFVQEAFVWDTVVIALRDSFAFLDKEWIAADPRRGYLYMAYARFSESTPWGQIECIASYDGGLTWQDPVVVDPADDYIHQGARPAVGPDGEVYVAWEYGIYDPPVDEIRLRRSDDFGRSFGPHGRVVKLGGEWRFPPPGHNRRLQHFPVIAVDRSHGRGRGDVYVAWNDGVELVEGPWNGRLRRDAAGDSPDAAQRVLLGDDVRARLHVVEDQDWFRIALEQGQAMVVRAVADWPVDPVAFLFCGDGEHQLAAINNDYGTTSPVIKYVAQAAGDYYVAVVANGFQSIGDYRLTVRAAHAPEGSVARDLADVMVARSRNGGLTWSPPQRVNDGPAYGMDFYPALAVNDQGWVLAGWHDSREGTDCSTAKGYYAAFARHGLDFGGNFALSDTAVTWFGYPLVSPNFGDYTDLAADGLSFHAVWSDARAGTPDIWTAAASVPFPGGSDDGLVGGAPGADHGRTGGTPEAGGIATARLLAAVPNPATTGASVEFALASDGPARLDVFDLAGRHVTALLDGRVLPPGRHARFWDLRDASGGRVPAGVYLVSFRSRAGAQTRRLAVVR